MDNYSTHLVQAIRLCLFDNPAQRITASDLLGLINASVPDDDGTPEDRMIAETAKAARDGRNIGAQWPAFVDFDDPYKIGFSFQGIAQSMPEETVDETP